REGDRPRAPREAFRPWVSDAAVARRQDRSKEAAVLKLMTRLVLSCREVDDGADSRPPPHGRLDQHVTIHEIEAIPHADQAQAGPFQGRADIKATAVIHDIEMQSFWCAA